MHCSHKVEQAERARGAGAPDRGRLAPAARRPGSRAGRPARISSPGWPAASGRQGEPVKRAASGGGALQLVSALAGPVRRRQRAGRGGRSRRMPPTPPQQTAPPSGRDTPNADAVAAAAHRAALRRRPNRCARPARDLTATRTPTRSRHAPPVPRRSSTASPLAVAPKPSSHRRRAASARSDRAGGAGHAGRRLHLVGGAGPAAAGPAGDVLRAGRQPDHPHAAADPGCRASSARCWCWRSA